MTCLASFFMKVSHSLVFLYQIFSELYECITSGFIVTLHSTTLFTAVFTDIIFVWSLKSIHMPSSILIGC